VGNLPHASSEKTPFCAHKNQDGGGRKGDGQPEAKISADGWHNTTKKTGGGGNFSKKAALVWHTYKTERLKWTTPKEKRQGGGGGRKRQKKRQSRRKAFWGQNTVQQTGTD